MADYVSMEQAGLGDEFAALIEDLDQMRQESALLEESMRQIRAEIESQMDSAGVQAVRGRGWRVMVQRRESETLKRDLLIANGIDPDLLDRCAVRRQYTVVDVRRERR